MSSYNWPSCSCDICMPSKSYSRKIELRALPHLFKHRRVHLLPRKAFRIRNPGRQLVEIQFPLGEKSNYMHRIICCLVSPELYGATSATARHEDEDDEPDLTYWSPRERISYGSALCARSSLRSNLRYCYWDSMAHRKIFGAYGFGGRSVALASRRFSGLAVTDWARCIREARMLGRRYAEVQGLSLTRKRFNCR
jgi:hypothetical protein